jgi:hypothetical protein
MPRYTEIPLDKLRPLRFSWGAMRELEETLDAKGFQGTFDPEKMGFAWVSQLLFVGLKHGDPRFGKTLTLEKVDDLIQEHWMDADRHLEDLMTHIMDGMRASGVLPKTDEDDDDGKKGNVEPQVDSL